MGTGYEVTVDETGDYVLERGHVWITVGELSVRMEKYEDEQGGLHIEVYRRGEEDKDPLCYCSTRAPKEEGTTELDENLKIEGAKCPKCGSQNIVDAADWDGVDAIGPTTEGVCWDCEHRGAVAEFE